MSHEKDFTRGFQWQNFIFRKGAEKQTLVYRCEIDACYSGNCDPNCPIGGRRRRDALTKSGTSSKTGTPSLVDFYFEVYKSRKSLEQAMRLKNNDFGQDMFITIFSSVLVFGLATFAMAYWLIRLVIILTKIKMSVNKMVGTWFHVFLTSFIIICPKRTKLSNLRFRLCVG